MYSIDRAAIAALELVDTSVQGKLRFAADVVAASAGPSSTNPRATQRSAHMLTFFAELAEANADRDAAAARLTEVLDLAGETVSTKAFGCAVDVIVGAMRGAQVAA